MFILKTAVPGLLLLLVLLQGCGRKGPLFIQQQPVKATPEQSEQASPTPSQTEMKK